jgi:hypothetical protein
MEKMDGNSHEEKHELEDMKLGGECFRKDSFSTSSKEETLYTRWDRYFKEAWEKYPRKAGNKEKARRDYLKKIDSMIRVTKFLESMEKYVESVREENISK